MKCISCGKIMIRDNNGYYQCYNCGIENKFDIFNDEKTLKSINGSDEEGSITEKQRKYLKYLTTEISHNKIRKQEEYMSILKTLKNVELNLISKNEASEYISEIKGSIFPLIFKI